MTVFRKQGMQRRRPRKFNSFMVVLHGCTRLAATRPVATGRRSPTDLGDAMLLIPVDKPAPNLTNYYTTFTQVRGNCSKLEFPAHMITTLQ